MQISFCCFIEFLFVFQFTLFLFRCPLFLHLRLSFIPLCLTTHLLSLNILDRLPLELAKYWKDTGNYYSILSLNSINLPEPIIFLQTFLFHSDQAVRLKNLQSYSSFIGSICMFCLT